MVTEPLRGGKCVTEALPWKAVSVDKSELLESKPRAPPIDAGFPLLRDAVTESGPFLGICNMLFGFSDGRTLGQIKLFTVDSAFLRHSITATQNRLRAAVLEDAPQDP